MKIINFSVERPVAISMFIVALVLVGIVSLPMLRVDLYPEMELPVALITTNYEGASPAEVENLVTKPLESALSTVNNVKNITSFSEPGVSNVVLDFNWGTDMDQAALDMRDKVDMVKGMLPSDVKSPRVLKLDPNSFPVLSYTLSGTDIEELKRVAEDVLKPRLERVEGVASVNVIGGKDREIKVILDPARLQTYGLTAGQVAQAVNSENMAGTAGSTNRGASDLTIRVTGEYKEARDLASVSVGVPGGGTVRLGDLGEIKDDYKKVTQISYVNGKPSVALYVLKATGSNTVQVAARVKDKAVEIEKELPRDMKIDTVMDLSKFISDAINNVAKHGVLGGLLAVVVLYLFLGSFRSTLVVALVIPISVIGTFSMIYFAGQTINMLSLGGLALGIGSLVDFSVVVLESIYRYRREGYGIIESAKTGAGEVGNAVMASAMAQVVVFLPIVFVQGLAGILFGPLALTVSFSHLAALFAALTLVPMMASKLLRNLSSDSGEDEVVRDAPLEHKKTPLHVPSMYFRRFFKSLTLKYSVLLNWALGNRKKVVTGTIVLLIFSLALIPLVGTEFMPAMDQGQISIDIEMPPGTHLQETGKVVSRIEEIVGRMPENDVIFSRVGSGGAFAMLGGGSTELATMQVKLKSLEQREASTEQLVQRIRKETASIPGATITVKVFDESGGPQGKPISVLVRGDDLEVLRDLGRIIEEEVKSVSGTQNVTSNLEDARQELQVVVDRQKAADYGVSAVQVLTAVRTAFDGTVVSRMRTGEDEIDIRVMYPENYRLDPSNLSRTMINTPTGAKVAVGEVAAISYKDAPETIMRHNQARLLMVDTEISGRDLGSINKDIEARMEKLALPAGYTYELRGQAKDMAESFGNLGLAMLLSVILVYMVMAAQFESLFYPFVIMFSLPPTIIGVVLGLLITGYHLSVPAFIGMIMLIGIVVNNAIVLIDYINTLRKRGLERNDAIRKAGPIRLRPIAMTTLSTVLALLPLAFGGGEGSEGRAPLAVVVAFGLTLSTLVTLVLVPVVYTIFDDLGQKIKARLAGGKMAAITEGASEKE